MVMSIIHIACNTCLVTNDAWHAYGVMGGSIFPFLQVETVALQIRPAIVELHLVLFLAAV